MSDHEHAQFDANKIFIALIILTAVEVVWGMYMPGPNWWVWGGLISMAFGKGILILQYFMHFKFEGWIVKCLMVPTPVLIMVLVAAISPDVAYNGRMDHGLTDMADPVTGENVILGSTDEKHDDEQGEGH